MNNSESNQYQGTSDVSAKEILNTHGSGEPAADNVDVSADDWKKYNTNNNSESGNESNERKGTSEVSAKEILNTHGSGEPAADNVEVSADD